MRIENVFFYLIFTLTHLVSGLYISYQGFVPRTLTTHRTTGEWRGQSFIPLYHFHPFTNIQTFICNYRTACIYEVATRWDLPPYRITIWLINDVKFLFVYVMIWFYLFYYSNLRRETGGLELISTKTLIKAIWLTKCASHSIIVVKETMKAYFC